MSTNSNSFINSGYSILYNCNFLDNVFNESICLWEFEDFFVSANRSKQNGTKSLEHFRCFSINMKIENHSGVKIGIDKTKKKLKIIPSKKKWSEEQKSL
jgi:hypothetical protein